MAAQHQRHAPILRDTIIGGVHSAMRLEVAQQRLQHSARQKGQALQHAIDTNPYQPAAGKWLHVYVGCAFLDRFHQQ